MGEKKEKKKMQLQQLQLLKKVIDLVRNYGKLLLFKSNETKRNEMRQGETRRDEANFSNFNVEISNFRVQHTQTHTHTSKLRPRVRKGQKKD